MEQRDRKWPKSISSDQRQPNRSTTNTQRIDSGGQPGGVPEANVAEQAHRCGSPRPASGQLRALCAGLVDPGGQLDQGLTLFCLQHVLRVHIQRPAQPLRSWKAPQVCAPAGQKVLQLWPFAALHQKLGAITTGSALHRRRNRTE